MALQSDGKIIVTGLSHNSLNYDIILLRFTNDGGFDTVLGPMDSHYMMVVIMIEVFLFLCLITQKMKIKL